MKRSTLRKRLLLLSVLSITGAFTADAQPDRWGENNKSVVTITVIGNKNLKLSVDATDFAPANGIAVDNKTTITYSNLEMGQHTLLVTRAGRNAFRPERISTIFNLRPRFDMLVKVNANGSLELIETKRSGLAGNNPVPMGNAEFATLLNNVRAQRSNNTKRSLLAAAFNNTSNYFSTSQVIQLLQTLNTEGYRLELAKSSYRSITDRTNFNQVYSLFYVTANRLELENYVNNYEENDLVMAMPETEFNTLYQGIQRQWPVSVQVTSLTNAFNNNNNHFSASQARQLIQLVNTENTRLQLAKLSYRSVADPANFSLLYDLFTNQASKNELQAYVNNYNPDYSPNTAMSDVNFNALYQSIQQQYPASTQMNSLVTAFNNSSNYFTTYQVRQLILLINSEPNRLQLAKLSYRTITDPANFTQLYTVFSYQSSKDELQAYVNNYSPGSTYNLPMTNENFTTLYQSIQRQFLPNEKLNSLTAVFNTTTNYFTSAQAKQLIQLVSFEANRLQLAKSSYRSITDRENFSQVYDVLSSQVSRNELDEYVRTYRD